MASQQTLHTSRKDELLRTLADSRRRAILSYLQQAPGNVATIRMLADELDTSHSGDDNVNEVVLVHTDLPKLEAAGVITFDKQGRTVRYRPDPVLERLLESIAEV